MPNIPGANNVLPGVFTDIVTNSRGLSLPGGTRIPAFIGEGSTDETIVSTAQGGGNDGLDPTYSSTSGADGRHFQLLNFPLISNRTTLFKNGVPLVGLESLIDNNAFSNKYDYRVDITSGKVELQRAHLVDLGGANYVPLSTNVGIGTLNNLTLTDQNAPPETWTVRCVSVQRDNSNNPIALTAKFLAFGSISGAKLDANGNPVVWQANNNIVTNGVLSFSILEGIVVFREGDAFTIKVASGVLNRSDTLTANYIPTLVLNDPLLLQGMSAVVGRHGFPSIDNNLSLGCQLAFANSTPAVMTVQAAPPMPRRKSFELETVIDSLSTNPDDFIFPLPLGVTPDPNSNIHFFINNPTTNKETQILPNKLTYYTLDTAGFPTTNSFIFDNVPAPGGFSYFYTVKQTIATIDTGHDGYVGRDLAFGNKVLFSSSVTYDASYVGKTLKIIEAENVANIGSYIVSAVTSGKLYSTYDGSFPDFAAGVTVAFQVIDPTTGLPVVGGSGTDGVITPILSTATATLTSATIDFGSLTGIATKRIQINGTVANNGLYDITASGSFTVTIKKVVVNESGLRYEVLDSTDVSNYVVINKNVVPNGYGLRVTLVDYKEATFYDAGWINALASLELVECDILVPLPKQTISVIFQNSLSHCKSMSNIRNKKERVLFIGAISGLKPDNLTGFSAAAVEDIGILEGIQGATITDVLAGNVEDLANYSVPDAFGNTFRAVYFYPDQIVVQAGAENILVDGFYIAAAAAGFFAADVSIQNPLTNKVLSGFTILRNKQYSTLTLESLAAAGVTVLQPVSGGGRVIWGITTTQSGFPEEQEISIVFIRDRIAKSLRAGFAAFVGTPETPDTQLLLNARATVMLNAFASQGLITNYKDLTVGRDTVDPRQWNLSVRVQPNYPINFIYIKVSVGTL